MAAIAFQHHDGRRRERGPGGGVQSGFATKEEGPRHRYRAATKECMGWHLSANYKAIWRMKLDKAHRNKFKISQVHIQWNVPTHELDTKTKAQRAFDTDPTSKMKENPRR